MIIEKVCTTEEQFHIAELRKNYSDDKIYEAMLEDYLEEINFVKRAAEYLDNKWYTKVFRFFANLGVKKGKKSKEEKRKEKELKEMKSYYDWQ